jgi:phosphoribosylformylglycinamidine (FGAM) synthase-like enzyme
VKTLRPCRYELPWEDKSFEYPPNLAPPNQILIDASNGASDYGNKFGEPLIAGYTRTFGQRLPGGERREWIKPIMFRCCGGWLGRNGCSLSELRLPHQQPKYLMPTQSDKTEGRTPMPAGAVEEAGRL